MKITTALLVCFVCLEALALAELNPVERNNIAVFEAVSESVVNVQNIQLARSIWDFEPVEIPAGAGSGFVWDTLGHVVTNYHVVAEGSVFLVTFRHDSKPFKAEIVGAEPKKDLAVLRVTERRGKAFIPLKVGTSKGLQVGQQAIAIGSPFGLDQTMTSGIISALGRSIQGVGGVSIRDMIQTDAAINPGNSGGPLLNSNGELIGINTMIASSSGSSAGVGFAVPVDAIARIVPQLIQYGKVVRPGLGIGVLPEQYRARVGIEKGSIITYVDQNGPAARAGLRGMSRDAWGRFIVGDIIVAIDGNEVNNLDDIYSVLEKYKIGDVVTVTFIRDTQRKTVRVTLTQV